MKTLVSAFILALGLNAFADTSCNIQLTGQNFGPVAIMKIDNPEVVQEIQKLFPYSDCYNGVCSYTYDREDDAMTFYFSKKNGNGFWARGQAAEYRTFWTDNGMWFSITSGEKSYSRLFKDGCSL